MAGIARTAFEYVTRSAIRTQRFAAILYRKKYPRVRIPDHLCVSGTMQRQISRCDFYRAIRLCRMIGRAIVLRGHFRQLDVGQPGLVGG